MIDVTIIRSPKMHFTKDQKKTITEGKTPTRRSEKQAADKDTDAHWSAKRGQWVRGYKARANADQKHKLIRLLEVTPPTKATRTTSRKCSIPRWRGSSTARPIMLTAATTVRPIGKR